MHLRCDRRAQPHALRNCTVSQHDKPRAGVVLAQQGEPIDRNRAVAMTASQTALKIGQHSLLAIGRERAGEGHVETEIIKDVRVSPAPDVPDLPRREMSRQALAAVGARQGRPEIIEVLHA
jgi:hypothetical protein